MALDRDRLLKSPKKLRKLINKIDNKPTPEEVHDLRTNTRRFEALFEVLSLDRQRINPSVVKRLAGCRKRAGKVRDMDVLTSYASTVHIEGEDDCAVRLLEYLGAQRRRLARKLHAEVQRRGPGLRKDLKRTPAVLKKAIQNSSGEPSKAVLAPNAAATAVKLAVQLASPPRLGKQNLHPYRLKVKELRNVLQMAASPSRLKFVDDLGEVKDKIGEWHDWEELVSIAQEVLDHGNGCGLLAELKNTAKQKYADALALAESLRRKYLRSPRLQKKSASAASAKVPVQPVWEAIAMLAA